MLKYNDEPRRSFLSFKKEQPALRIGIYEPCVDIVSELLHNDRRISRLQTEWKFTSFESDVRKGFGFNRVCTSAIVEGGYLILTIPLLRDATMPIAVSVGHLLNVLCYLEHLSTELLHRDAPVDPHRFQLMSLEGAVVREAHFAAAPIGGYVSPIFTNWVERTRAHQERLEEVENAMTSTWRALSVFPRESNTEGAFRTDFCCVLGKNGSFYLRVLGNACDVSTLDWWNRRRGEGHEIGCHNLDSPLQQMSLLAGLASMHDIAVRAIDP